MRQIIRGGLAVLALWAATGAPAARAETLADALAFGYEASGLIEQNRALLRAADEDVAQAVAALRPILSWQLSANASYPGSGFAARTVGSTDLAASLALVAGLTVYDGGANRLAVDAQKELVLATREGLVDVEQQVLFRIVQAYQEVRRSSEFVALRQSNVRLIEQELRAARERFDVGEVTRTDVALAEAALAAARSELTAEEGNLTRAVEEFRAAVGRAPQALQPAPPARVGPSLEEARAVARVTHPALRQAQHEVAAAEINIRRGEAALRPSVSLEAQLGLDDEGDDSVQAGVTVSGPIYRGGALASQIRQFRANRDAQRADLITTARAIEQNVGNAYALLEVARASRDAFAMQVGAAQAAFEGVREEAALGARTTLDVLDAEQDLLDARTNLVSSEVDEVVASYQVLQAMGLLTAANLGLRVQLYDPSAYYNLVDDAPAGLSDQGRALDRVLEAIGD